MKLSEQWLKQGNELQQLSKNLTPTDTVSQVSGLYMIAAGLFFVASQLSIIKGENFTDNPVPQIDYREGEGS